MSVWHGGLVLVVLATGCATRGDVDEAARVNRMAMVARLEKLEAQVGTQAEKIGWMIGTVADQGRTLDATSARVDAAAASVEQTLKTAKAADETARGAVARADNATVRADAVSARMTKLFGARGPATVVKTTDVQFSLGKAALRDEELPILATIANDMKANPALMLELTGYTDASGAPEQNNVLSQRRADAVKRYLVWQGVEQRRVFAIGLGPIMDVNVAPAEKRRVTVRVVTFGQ